MPSPLELAVISAQFHVPDDALYFMTWPSAQSFLEMLFAVLAVVEVAALPVILIE